MPERTAGRVTEGGVQWRDPLLPRGSAGFTTHNVLLLQIRYSQVHFWAFQIFLKFKIKLKSGNVRSSLG